MKKPKKAKADKVVEATFPTEMNLTPHYDQLRAIYRKLGVPLPDGDFRFLVRGTWSSHLTNAQLADLTEHIRARYPLESIINYGLWEITIRLMKRPKATRVNRKNAEREAMILAMPDPS